MGALVELDAFHGLNWFLLDRSNRSHVVFNPRCGRDLSIRVALFRGCCEINVCTISDTRVTKQLTAAISIRWKRRCGWKCPCQRETPQASPRHKKVPDNRGHSLNQSFFATSPILASTTVLPASLHHALSFDSVPPLTAGNTYLSMFLHRGNIRYLNSTRSTQPPVNNLTQLDFTHILWPSSQTHSIM